MTCVDASVALAHLFAEDRRPPDTLWNETLVASRLLQYEVWTGVHRRGVEDSHDLRRQGQTIELATYDRRMRDAATAMDIPSFDLPA